ISRVCGPVHVRAAKETRPDCSVDWIRRGPRRRARDLARDLAVDSGYCRSCRERSVFGWSVRSDENRPRVRCADLASVPTQRRAGAVVRRGQLPRLVAHQQRGDPSFFDAAGHPGRNGRPKSASSTDQPDLVGGASYFFFEITCVTKNFWPSWFSASALWSWFIQRILMHRRRSWPISRMYTLASWRFFIPIRMAPAFRLSMSCSRLTYRDLTPFRRAFSCIIHRMREVFIVPGVPATRTVLPRGMPPPRARSRP